MTDQPRCETCRTCKHWVPHLTCSDLAATGNCTDTDVGSRVSDHHYWCDEHEPKPASGHNPEAKEAD